MGNRTVTRADLVNRIADKVGFSRAQSAQFVEDVLGEITSTLSNGENVKLSSFGSFTLRDKRGRVGRNPKTGEEVPIEPRRVLIFRASHVLKDHINRHLVNGSGSGGP